MLQEIDLGVLASHPEQCDSGDAAIACARDPHVMASSLPGSGDQGEVVT